MISEQTAHRFCKDDISKIENYDKAIADTTQTWVIHHKLEFTLDGEFAHYRDELKRLGMYYHRPYFELIFLTKSEHHSLHNKGLSKSTKQKQKISESLKGKKHAEESIQKISESLKAYWAQRRQEKLQ